MSTPMTDISSPPTKVRKLPRGRPRKKTATLEEDLQFSSEEELDEVPLNEFEEKGILISAEMPVPGADDDSQQAAEAMVQLGTMGYFHPSEGDHHEGIIFKGKEKIIINWKSIALKNTLIRHYLSVQFFNIQTTNNQK